MQILVDWQLKELLQRADSPIRNLDPDHTDLSSIDSQIQPCSIDLRIDEIVLPRQSVASSTSDLRATSHDLAVGSSVVVTTAEQIRMPKNLAGLLVAPARITRRGVMVLDVGHVDPGFEGSLSFTLINMGRHAMPLRRNLTVATMLLIQLNQPCEMGLMEQKGNQPYETKTDDRNHLASDFLSIEQRAKEAACKEARRALGKSGWRYALISVFLPITLGIAFAFITYSLQIAGRLSSLEGQVSRISTDSKINQKLNNLETQVKQIRDEASKLAAPKDSAGPEG